MSASLRSKGSQVRFPVRAHVWVAGQVPGRGYVRGNHTFMLLSVSLSLPLCLKINKIFLKKTGKETGAERERRREETGAETGAERVRRREDKRRYKKGRERSKAGRHIEAEKMGVKRRPREKIQPQSLWF